MPRIARQYIETPYVHIITQGIDREEIFKGNYLKNFYMKILDKKIKETEIKTLAYCIMDNHMHMLLYVPKIDELSNVMKKVNTSYAKEYNRLKDRVGYVFRDRYYLQKIMSEKHMLNCIVYIHNNPVKANIVKKEIDYKYSSYAEYLGKKTLITEEGINIVFGKSNNYIELFEKIHKTKKTIDNIDDINEKIDKNKIIEAFLKNNNVDMTQVIENEKMFSKLLIELNTKSRISLRNLSKIFNINKDKLNKIIKK